MGLLAKQFKECDTSKRLLEQVIQINPHHADSYNNLGSVNQELGEIEQAIDCYKKAIQISPNHSDAYNNLGNTYRELGETQEAINCYEKVIDSCDHVLISKPNDQNIYNRRQSALHFLNV